MKNTQNTITKNIIRTFLGIISLSFLIGLYACEEDPSSLGSDLLPDENKVKYYFDKSLSFKGNVYSSDSIYTTNRTNYTIGYINDEHFGEFKGEFASQFLPLLTYSKDSVVVNFDVDSVVLYLEIDSTYGSPINDLMFDVYELNKTIEPEAYFSDEDVSNYYDPLDKINTTSIISGDSLIRLQFNSAFIDKLIPDNEEDSTYKSHANFLSVFKGLAVKPNVLATTRGLCTVNMESSKITLFYNDTLEYSYKFVKENTASYRFANYTTDYTNAVVNNYLTNPDTVSDDLLFLQGINGVFSEIIFNNIDSFVQDDSLYSLLSADLIIPVYEDNNIDFFAPPERLFIQYNPTDTTLYTIEDFNNKIADGYYNKEKSYYHFSITKHLMSIINKEITAKSLKLNIENKSTFPNRVILKSGDNIKLHVTYTKH